MLPPGERIVETKKCRISGQEFFITDKDIYLLDKISPTFDGYKYALPTPDLCPDMRYLNRLTWRNERTLFSRICSMTGENIITIHHADVPFPVYNQKTWWSDDWNSLDYGRNFDFNRPFFPQFKELYNVVPQIALNSPRSENSEYTNQSEDLKDCYLCFCCDQSRSCFFGMGNGYSEDCVDCSYINFCNSCYELLRATKCSNCYYSQNLENCSDVEWSRDCKGCSNCFGCINLKNVSYYIFNQQVTKEHYQEQINKLRKNSNLRENLEKLFSKHPKKYYVGHTNENSCGDYIMNNKDTFYCFNSRENEFLRYSQDASKERFCTDLTETLIQDFCTHIEGSMNNSNCGFCMKMWDVADAWYCSHLFGVHRAFGCVGLKQQKNCIFNKTYSEHEWQTLAAQIASHMKTTGEWGKHFPSELSPFAFNISMAGEYFPMTEMQAKHFGWQWLVENKNKLSSGTYEPLPIEQYDERKVGPEVSQKNIDELIKGIISCKVTGRAFKIIKKELAFYIENSLPIPTKHPDQRYKERMNLRNPRTLYERTCAECQKAIITTYSPDRSERVVCENCYRSLVY